jgi:hypothetical protein
MERISDLTGKVIQETLPFLEYDTRKVCDECGEAKMVYNCPFCGAPNCCHGCGCPSLVDSLCEES